MDRLKALSVLKAVAENGSFVAGASALGISPAMTTRVYRTTRRVALTAVGEDVVRRAAGLLHAYDELVSIGRLSASEPSDVIRMAAPASFARRYLGAALAAFCARYAQVQVDLLLCEDAANAIPEGVDIAVCLPEDLRSAQVARPLATAEVGVYAAPSYLAHKGEPTHPSQLGEHVCLTSRSAGTGANWEFRHSDSGDACTVSVTGALQASQTEMLADAAAHGAGVAMLPAFLAQAAVAQGRLRRILPGWRVPSLSLQLVYNSRRNQPMSVRKLIEHLLETLGAVHEFPSRPALRLVQDEPPAADAPAHAGRAAGRVSLSTAAGARAARDSSGKGLHEQ